MSGSGKGGNNRRSRHRFSGRKDESLKNEQKKHTDNFLVTGKSEKNPLSMYERLRWTAPVLPANPITTPDCPWCGKKITDITSAIADKETGRPIHFSCVLGRVTDMVSLETNDSVCYIGGGRFGVVHYNNPPDIKDFTIKRIIEWEEKDNSSDWRVSISEYFSIT
ncbi:MAG: hypothetical protein LBI04_05350 [Treponema sp.]|jgi:hypothetical protein|nr:hypothetical protein [Treponema sp.]